MENNFIKRVNGVKQETIGARPSNYSEWHRTLGIDFKAVDIDFVEYRESRGIVGLFGVTGRCKDKNHINNSKKYIIQRTYVERKILKELAEGKDYSSYLVIHTEDLSVFHVWNLNKCENPEWIEYSKEEYEKFIKNL